MKEACLDTESDNSLNNSTKINAIEPIKILDAVVQCSTIKDKNKDKDELIEPIDATTSAYALRLRNDTTNDNSLITNNETMQFLGHCDKEIKRIKI